MRSRNEPVEVRLGRIGEGISGLDQRDEEFLEGPSQFLWRQRLWRVLRVQAHWIESGAWWEGAGVRAARGDWEADDADEFASFLPAHHATGSPSLLVGSGAAGAGDPRGEDPVVPGVGRGVPGGSSPLADDILEYEVWRVEAASGQFFSRGVYELAQDTAAGSWRLRSVVD